MTDDYILNPTIHIARRWTTRRKNQSLKAFYFEDLPVRMQNWLRHLIALELDVDLAIDVDDDLFSIARQLGIIITQSELADSPAGYWCGLPDESRFSSSEILDSMHCHLQMTIEKPEAIRSRVRTGPELWRHLPRLSPLGPLAFDARLPILWVDHHLGLLEPIWLSQTPAEDGRRLLPGESQRPSPSRVPLAKLAARDDFASHGHATIRDALSPNTLAAVGRYYRDLARCGFFADVPGARRSGIYCDVLALYWQHQMTSLVEFVVGEAVKPSYTWIRRYASGAELPRHIDRSQCRWNVSFCVDIEPQEGDIWPFFVETRGQVHEVRLGVGDAVIYGGTNTPHWRDRLNDREVTVYLFHYVPENSAGSLG